MNQQQHQGYQNQDRNYQQQQLPQYGQVQGQTIRLAGLDYNLLQQELRKQERQKRNILDSLKNKINIISGNVFDRVHSKDGDQNEKTKMKDKYYKTIQRVIQINGEVSHFSNEHKKSETYLLFQLDQFGKRKPQLIQKRIGKISSKPKFVQFSNEFLKQFSKLLKLKQSNIIDAKQIVQQSNYMVDDEDDIFGDLKQNHQGPQKYNSQINIQIGKKLNFGIEEDIFQAVKRPRPIEMPEKNQEQKDKYFFMRKQIKKNTQQDDGYGQCYYQSGPSLKQLVDLKKQGIEYYGDLQESKPKQKKGPNIHKQYEMVKKIIQKKKKQ